jgi:hypothetical protein
LELIVDRIRKTFLELWRFKSPKYKDYLSVADILIRMVQKTYFKLKSQGVKVEELVKDFKEKVKIWRFLRRNIPINHVDDTVDYNPLYRIMDRIEKVKLNNFPPGIIKPLNLSKQFALLGVYLYDTWLKIRNEIFNVNNPQRPIFLYLILKLYGSLSTTYFTISQEFVPGLENCLDELYQDGNSLNLSPMVSFIDDSTMKTNIQKFIGIESQSYLEIWKFVEQKNVKLSLQKLWDLKALANIEFFLIQKGAKVI